MTYNNLDTGLPRHGIESSLNKGLLLYKNLGDKDFNTRDIYKILNLSTKSGHANRAIVSMKYYGIIEISGSDYKLNEIVKKYSINKGITQKDFLTFLNAVPLYKNILKEFSIDELANINNKNKIRDYINKLKLDGKNTIDVFFEINDANSRYFRNLKFNDSYEQKEKIDIKNDNILPSIIKDNDFYNYLSFSIGVQKTIDLKYPKNIDKKEIELIEIALECMKKIIIKCEKGDEK